MRDLLGGDAGQGAPVGALPRGEAAPGAVPHHEHPADVALHLQRGLVAFGAELEGIGRGPYTGALGYVNRNGDMDLNILIRSLWLQGDTLQLRAGAGIVFDSEPAHELQETRAKARGLLRALGAAE